MQQEPILGELAGVGSRLLRVDAAPGKGPALVAGLALTFEHARLCVEPAEGSLRLGMGAEVPLPPGALDVAEGDPWWTVLGAPLAAAWAVRDPDHDDALLTLDLQLRHDDESPKLICLQPADAGLRVRALSRDAWLRRVGG